MLLHCPSPFFFIRYIFNVLRTFVCMHIFSVSFSNSIVKFWAIFSQNIFVLSKVHFKKIVFTQNIFYILERYMWSFKFKFNLIYCGI